MSAIGHKRPASSSTASSSPRKRVAVAQPDSSRTSPLLSRPLAQQASDSSNNRNSSRTTDASSRPQPSPHTQSTPAQTQAPKQNFDQASHPIQFAPPPAPSPQSAKFVATDVEFPAGQKWPQPRPRGIAAAPQGPGQNVIYPTVRPWPPPPSAYPHPMYAPWPPPSYQYPPPPHFHHLSAQPGPNADSLASNTSLPGQPKPLVPDQPLPPEGKPLVLAQHPNRIAALIKQKRAENAALGFTSKYVRNQNAHFVSQTAEQQLKNELNTRVSYSNTPTPAARLTGHAATANPQAVHEKIRPSLGGGRTPAARSAGTDKPHDRISPTRRTTKNNDGVERGADYDTDADSLFSSGAPTPKATSLPARLSSPPGNSSRPQSRSGSVTRPTSSASQPAEVEQTPIPPLFSTKPQNKISAKDSEKQDRLQAQQYQTPIQPLFETRPQTQPQAQVQSQSQSLRPMQQRPQANTSFPLQPPRNQHYPPPAPGYYTGYPWPAPVPPLYNPTALPHYHQALQTYGAYTPYLPQQHTPNPAGTAGTGYGVLRPQHIVAPAPVPTATPTVKRMQFQISTVESMQRPKANTTNDTPRSQAE